MLNKTKGMLWILASALGFSLMGLFVKLSGDLPVVQKAFFRNLVACVVALMMIIKYRAPLIGQLRHQHWLILRSILGIIGVLLNFYAIDHLVLSDSDMLNKLSPFILIILSAIFLKEHPTKIQILGCIIAFTGTLFIIKPVLSAFNSSYMIGLFGALSAASAYLCLRILANKESGHTIVFYFSTVSVIVLGPLMLINYQSMTWQQLIYLLCSGLAATLGQFGVTFGYQYAAAKDVSIYTYFSVVFSAIFSLIIFDQMPDVWSILGYMIIFLAGYMMFRVARGK